MDDKTTQTNQDQPVTTGQDPVSPVTPEPPAADKPVDSTSASAQAPATSDPVSVDKPTEPIKEPVVPAGTAVPDSNKDLKTLSQDLENLAKEAQQTDEQPAAEKPVEKKSVDTPASASVPLDKPTVPVPPTSLETDPVMNREPKITIYTTPNCQFCKAEKEFLDKEKLQYQEKNVEEDTDALKEMLNVSDNFAGVPVTVLEGPKGKKVVKGFTQDEFVKELSNTGIKEGVQAQTSASVEATTDKPEKAPEAPKAPIADKPVVEEKPSEVVPVESKEKKEEKPIDVSTSAKASENKPVDKPEETPTVPDLDK